MDGGLVRYTGGTKKAFATPVRMHADAHYRGRGVTLALVDSGFYPHRDLIEPHNRIRAWADATSDPVDARFFSARERPAWPGADAGLAIQWHGMMTSVVAAGSGFMSGGLYRGLASEADVVLVQVADANGKIRDASIHRALRWLALHAERLRLRVVNISVAGDAAGQGNPIDSAASALVKRGITVVAAAGNDGVRRLLPPSTCPDVITVGGLDEHGDPGEVQRSVWHSNYGESTIGALKPELVAPSIWVVAPLLPGSAQQHEAEELFRQSEASEVDYEANIESASFVGPHYKLVEGTSFSAPIVASTVACMLEANPSLSPDLVKQCLAQACQFVEGAPKEQQGLGAIDAGRAVACALQAKGGAVEGYAPSPVVTPQGIVFLLRRREALQVRIFGSWNGWASGVDARELQPGVWRAITPPLSRGRYAYKFVIDGRWEDDPANPRKLPDGHGGLNSIFAVS
jgi:serine protease AprX